MSDAAHRLLDNLVKDLETKLFAKTHQDIVVELDENAMQNSSQNDLGLSFVIQRYPSDGAGCASKNKSAAR